MGGGGGKGGLAFGGDREASMAAAFMYALRLKVSYTYVPDAAGICVYTLEHVGDIFACGAIFYYIA